MTERDRFINIIKRSISGMLTTNQVKEIAQKAADGLICEGAVIGGKAECWENAYNQQLLTLNRLCRERDDLLYKLSEVMLSVGKRPEGDEDKQDATIKSKGA